MSQYIHVIYHAYLAHTFATPLTRNFPMIWYRFVTYSRSYESSKAWQQWGKSMGKMWKTTPNVVVIYKLACVFFIMLCFPIFLNLCHLQRGKKWLIAKSYNSIALSLWQDQNEISTCIQEAQFHGSQLLHHTPPYPIQSPPTPFVHVHNKGPPHTPPPQ